MRRTASRRAGSATSVERKFAPFEIKGATTVNLSVRRASKNPPAAIFESDERAALAAAIDRRNILQRELDATNKALAEVSGKRTDARRAVEAAKQAVEDAKANAVAFLTATISGTAGAAPTSIKDARAALQEAEDAFETQHMLEESLNAKLPALDESLHFAKSRVRDKINAVVAADPSLRKLLTQYEEAKRLMVQRAQLFHFLWAAIPHDHRHWQSSRDYRLDEMQDETPPWRAAIAEL
jgi:hypothetical protein